MFLFPAIDIRHSQVVRLLQGEYDKQTTYGNDPLAQARAFAEAGATWLHVVDLDGARTGRPAHLEIIHRITAQTKLNVEVGGGVRSVETIDKLLAVGVRRVILGTAALKDWPWFEKLAQNPAYAGKIVLGLDAKDGMLAVAGWEQATNLSAVEVARRVRGWPLGAIVYTDIATDGTLAGPNLPATRAMIEATDVPIVASGGVGTLDHLRALRELKLQGVIVGKAIYENRFTVAQALAVLEQNIPAEGGTLES